MAPGARREFTLAGVKVWLGHVRTPDACDENAFTSGVGTPLAWFTHHRNNRRRIGYLDRPESLKPVPLV